MALLRKAAGMGYSAPATYRTETALDPLRGRDDFRLFVMDLAMPAQPLATLGEGQAILLRLCTWLSFGVMSFEVMVCLTSAKETFHDLHS